ncbi:hypothetical protein GE21DRAFT_1284402 [Neurospora crassa]|nr:hypothetical protein GE21DRAFT_1284402 [Neurospora crassa]
MAHGSCLLACSLACLLVLVLGAYVYTCVHFKTCVRDQTQKQGERSDEVFTGSGDGTEQTLTLPLPSKRS